MAELQDGRTRFTEGEATVNRARNELLRTTSTLSSVKEALRQSRNLVALRTNERNSARGEVARLTASLAEARNEIAGLTGEVATARLQILGGTPCGLRSRRPGWRSSGRISPTPMSVSLEAQSVVAALQEHIGLSVALSEHLHPVSPEDAEKLADSSDRLARLLSRVLDMRESNTRFSGANKPSVGFNSPGFTGYVLRMERGKSPKSLPETDTPQLGDIIRYENGFDMFLLQDAEGEPFVIGMTPVGIAALEPDFGVPRAGALATGIFQQ